jgi:MscS family membrane protein
VSNTTLLGEVNNLPKVKIPTPIKLKEDNKHLKEVATKEEPTLVKDKLLLDKADIEKISSKEFRSKVVIKINDFFSWLKEESSNLIVFIGGVSLITAILLTFFKVLKNKKLQLSSTRKLSLKEEIFFSIISPIATIPAILIAFLLLLPLLKNTPTLAIFITKVFLALGVVCFALSGMAVIKILSLKVSNLAGKDNNSLDPLMVDILRKLVEISLIFITIFFIGQSIFNFKLTMMLTGAGVVGLAIAFAARETLANFFGTIVIILDEPFRCGDRIKINGMDGIVKYVGMRSTRIATANESIITIPNSLIESNCVENISTKGVIRYVFNIGLVYDTTPEEMDKALKIIHSIVDDFHGQDLEIHKPRVFFESFENSSLNIKVIMWLKTSSYEREETLRSLINRQILAKFNEEKLTFAFNTVTNYLCSKPEMPIVISYDKK